MAGSNAASSQASRIARNERDNKLIRLLQLHGSVGFEMGPEEARELRQAMYDAAGVEVTAQIKPTTEDTE